MTTDVFRRVLWKEYRMLRSFWLMLVAIVLGGQAIAYAGGAEAIGLYMIVSLATVLYTLGVSASVFAVEREEGTDNFLEALPVRSKELFAPKVVLVVGSAALLAAALSAITWLACQYLFPARTILNGPPKDNWKVAGLVALAACDALVWGLLFSLISRRPLVAACLGALAAFFAPFSGLVITGVTVAATGGNGIPVGETLGIVGMMGMLAGVFAVDVWLGGRWLDGWRRNTRTRHRATVKTTVQSAGPRIPAYPSAFAAFWRLVWQELRATGRLMAIFVGIGTLLCFWFGLVGQATLERLTIMTPVGIGLAAIMGGCVFLADQERSQFRFFAERPVRPLMVWLNRQVVWGTFIAILYLVATPLWVLWVFRGDVSVLFNPFHRPMPSPVLESNFFFSRSLATFPNWAIFFAFVLLAYCCGQLCSMLFRSGIIAAFLALVLALACCLWVGLTSAVGVSWMLSYAPLPITLLVATWLRTPDWIGERAGWRPWARVTASLGLPAIAVILATIAFRVWQIPSYKLDFSPQDFQAGVTPQARETAEMYFRAASGSENSLDLALAASTRPECIFPLSGEGELWGRLSKVAELIRAEATRLEEAGDLDGVFTCEMALLRVSVHMRRHQFATSYAQRLERETLDTLVAWWATRPGQTPERLRRAIQSLDAWRRTIPTPAEVITSRYIWGERLLALDPEAVAAVTPNNLDGVSATRNFVFISTLMPWEVARAQRVLKELTVTDLNMLHLVNEAIAADKPAAQWAAEGRLNISHRYFSTTPLIEIILTQSSTNLLDDWLIDLTRRQATDTRLALEAYRLEKGELPESLAPLVGPYLHRMPRDPFSGHELAYFVRGNPYELHWNFVDAGRMAPNTPFLWSSGPYLLALGSDDTFGFCMIGAYGVREGRPMSWLDGLKLGWAMPIVRPRDAQLPQAVTAPDPPAKKEPEVEPPPPLPAVPPPHAPAADETFPVKLAPPPAAKPASPQETDIFAEPGLPGPENPDAPQF